MRHDFFASPDPLSSYVAGFIAADGTVNKDRPRVQITTHMSDQHHLEEMMRIVECPNKITDNRDGSVKVGITSRPWIADLAEHYSIVPNKSLVLQPPNLKRQADIRAFITGYIDGDGSMNYKRSGNWAYLRVNIVGTRQMLEWIAENLPDAGKISQHGEVSRLDWGHSRAFAIHNLLWNPRLPLLERKWGKPYKVWIGNEPSR